MKLRDEVAVVIVTHNLQQALAGRRPRRASCTWASWSSTGRPSRSSRRRASSARGSTSAGRSDEARWSRSSLASQSRCCAARRAASRPRTRARGSSRRAAARSREKGVVVTRAEPGREGARRPTCVQDENGTAVGGAHAQHRPPARWRRSPVTIDVRGTRARKRCSATTTRASSRRSCASRCCARARSSRGSTTRSRPPSGRAPCARRSARRTAVDARACRAIDLTRPRLEQDPVSGVAAVGFAANRSKVEQRKLVVFAVARKGARVVAAGRAQINRAEAGQARPLHGLLHRQPARRAHLRSRRRPRRLRLGRRRDDDRPGARDDRRRRPLGEHGEPCARCGAPLAHDQRYCLNCGQRRADARLAVHGGAGAAHPPRGRRRRALPPPRRPPRPPAAGHRPVDAGAGVAVLRAGARARDPDRLRAATTRRSQVAAAPPQVISVAAPAAGRAGRAGVHGRLARRARTATRSSCGRCPRTAPTSPAVQAAKTRRPVARARPTSARSTRTSSRASTPATT